ncbi:hypothetical protein RG836_12370 [Pseudomonas sp. SZMC_28357]|uniref:hypothetical protein n=1 Tax=Pseudomonas sp. SZMC_28357 TaxID=3074380 RepID=UPI002870FF95|nr:hypothetical protein [Pseudomonas sp. SZMC_28357]MDR9752246.1 hypothetical protein [Pseudomonas sp. SZMC_28357]
MDASTYSTWLVAGAVVLVSDALSATEQQDALDALLYSRAVASLKHPDFADQALWAEAYKRAMRIVGGLPLDDAHVDIPNELPQGFTLSQLLMPIVACSALKPVHDAVQRSLQALSRYAAETSEMRLFREHLTVGKTGVRLHIAVVDRGLLIRSLWICFASDEVIAAAPLEQCFSQRLVADQIALYQHNVVIEEDDYVQSRDTVSSLLGGRRQLQLLPVNASLKSQ